MKIFKSKLGTDKPIEIFIALFVILAVAMVILKMFSSQIEQKKTEMEQEQQEERARSAMADLDIYCDSQCSKAHRTLKDKVSYCTSYFRGEIDINKNSMADFTMALDNIQGYCEDRIYCAAYRPCGSLDMANCKTLVCDYMEKSMNILDPVEKADRLVGYDGTSYQYEGWYQPGECWDSISDEDKRFHWFNNFLQVEQIDGTTGTCSYIFGACSYRSAEVLAEMGGTVPPGWGTDCVVY